MHASHARTIGATLLAAGLVGAAGGAAAAPAAAPAAEAEATEAGLRAVVQHWDDAELEGDVAYLEQLMLPGYRSVDAKGESHPRAAILEHAKHNAGSAEARKTRDAFMKAHPTELSVTLRGDLAIVAYFNPVRGLDHSIRGSDVFLYDAKRWHAVYSMHNGAQ
jgi:hypothetical protein